jgi:D-alanyl-D-alanine carboxypeptidase
VLRRQRLLIGSREAQRFKGLCRGGAMVSSGVAGGRRVLSLAGLLTVSVSVLIALSSPAEARRKHRKAGGGYNPPYAAIVVDAKTGRVLHAQNEEALRHPASVTKVMTLYLVFEQLERGRIALDTPLQVSANAARQAPSKLGLRPGSSIAVEDAIKALVTKSANDVAVVVAENLGGSEEAFAEHMTRKARALGMSRTVYRNASGLPDPEQVTTARDLTILARAIQDRFPRHYKFFQTRAFHYAGASYRNHNKLLGRVHGVDGIKTGFTRASGFNLMTSARTDDRHIVAVVLGGRSGASRDQAMASLVKSNLPRAYAGARTAPVVAEATERPRPAVVAAPRRGSRDHGRDGPEGGTEPPAARSQRHASGHCLRGLDDDADEHAALVERAAAPTYRCAGLCAGRGRRSTPTSDDRQCRARPAAAEARSTTPDARDRHREAGAAGRRRQGRAAREAGNPRAPPRAGAAPRRFALAPTRRNTDQLGHPARRDGRRGKGAFGSGGSPPALPRHPRQSVGLYREGGPRRHDALPRPILGL